MAPSAEKALSEEGLEVKVPMGRAHAEPDEFVEHVDLETHSLTHVHKHVSAELVEHAPSGAPEQLIWHLLSLQTRLGLATTARSDRVCGAHARALLASAVVTFRWPWLRMCSC